MTYFVVAIKNELMESFLKSLFDLSAKVRTFVSPRFPDKINWTNESHWASDRFPVHTINSYR